MDDLSVVTDAVTFVTDRNEPTNARGARSAAKGRVVLRIGPRNLLPRGNWLRRAGPARLLIAQGGMPTQISLPRTGASREWLAKAHVECDRCHGIAERTSPIQRRCLECRRITKQARSRESMRRRRHR